VTDNGDDDAIMRRAVSTDRPRRGPAMTGQDRALVRFASMRP